MIKSRINRENFFVSRENAFVHFSTLKSVLYHIDFISYTMKDILKRLLRIISIIIDLF